MSLLTIQRDGATISINTNRVAVGYDYNEQAYQVQLADGNAVTLTEDEYNKFVGENNTEE